MAQAHSSGRLVRMAVFASLWPLAMLAQAQTAVAGCSFEFTTGGGPYDYRNERQALQTVERRHFTSRVERLVSGESTTSPGPDIDYTLSKFPNHHRALLAVSRLGAKLKLPMVPDMRYPVDCYFERALRFRADDTVARLAYALHLARSQRQNLAAGQLEVAAGYALDNPLTHQNIGLVALEIGDHARALVHAHKVHALGMTHNKLRVALEKAGRWQEPAPAAAGPAASASPAANPAPVPAEVPASAP